MTPKELGDIKGLLLNLADRHIVPLLDAVMTALETAWAERDEAMGQRDTCSLELEAAINERDSAIMVGMALVQEKDGLQVEIDRLRAENAAKDQEVAALSKGTGVDERRVIKRGVLRTRFL